MIVGNTAPLAVFLLLPRLLLRLIVPLRDEFAGFVFDHHVGAMHVHRRSFLGVDVNIAIPLYLVSVNGTVRIVRPVFPVSCVLGQAYAELDPFQEQILNTRIDGPAADR